MNHRATANSLERLFSSHDLRCTRQRLALYKALAATKSHPTADELYRDLLPRADDMSLATVYNTLEALYRAGLIQKLPGFDGSTRYDACVDDHLHLCDLESGAVSDAPDSISHEFFKALPRHLLTRIEAKTGFQTRQVQVVLAGARNGK